jgi:hypothetical protein
MANGDRARGSSVIPASLDNEFKVVRDKNSPDDEMHLTFEQTLNKDSLHSTKIAFKLVDHTVTINDKKISSAYLEKIEFNFDDEDDMTWKLTKQHLWKAFEAETAVRAAEIKINQSMRYTCINLTFIQTELQMVKIKRLAKPTYMDKDAVNHQFKQMVIKKHDYIASEKELDIIKYQYKKTLNLFSGRCGR